MDKVTDFWMFTDAGNAAVAKIVELAESSNLPFSVVHDMLAALAQCESYSEATDTAVREAVYKALFGECHL